MRPKVSFIQCNFNQKSINGKNLYYLPYSVGVIWSYAKQYVNFDLDKILFKYEDAEYIAAQLSESDVVCFSTYIWNKEIHLATAKLIKQRNPSVKVVFGGPELDYSDINIFQKYSQIDYIVVGEGEETTVDLLNAIQSKSDIKKEVRGVIVNVRGFAITSPERDRIQEVDKIPSPYLTGIFDDIIKMNPDIQWHAILETSRGCPFSCTFCDWGHLTYQKVKKFDTDRIKQELDWMRQNNVSDIYCSDANFGAFKRDRGIIQYLVDSNKSVKWLDNFFTAWHKNQSLEILEYIKLLVDSGLSDGHLISLQTLTPEVLKNVKRDNLPLNNVSKIFEYVHTNKVPYRIELIVGLPGETLETWKQNYDKFYEMGVRDRFSIFQCSILNNSELASQVSEYGIDTVPMSNFMQYSATGTNESSQVINSSLSMPFSDMVKARTWDWFMGATHGAGNTNIIATILNNSGIVSYGKFYDGLYEFLLTKDWFSSRNKQMQERQEGALRGTSIDHSEIESNRSAKEVVIFIQFKRDLFFKDLGEYLRGIVDETELINDLINLQREFMTELTKIGTYPRHLMLSHNLIKVLYKEETVISRDISKYIIVTTLDQAKGLGYIQELKDVFFWDKHRTQIMRENSNENIMRNIA